MGTCGIGQFRSLGGSIGVAACINLMNEHVTSNLASILSTAQAESIEMSAKLINTLPEHLQLLVRDSYAQGFRKQAYSMTAFGTVSFLTVFLMWEKNP